MVLLRLSITLLAVMLLAAPSRGADQGEEGKEGAEGTIFTLWPLVDYRESPKEGFSNLSLLGPLFKYQKMGKDEDIAFRPLFYKSSHAEEQAKSTYILYPVAYQESTPQADTFQVLQLFRKSTYRKQEEQEREKSTTLFPFYISGESDKYGPYRAVFPIYGDIYERFWRDEYHFVLFPLYGSTVKRGTTTRHYLWPIFSTTSGEKEDGFGVFPLYGQSQKTGVYEKRYLLWPVFHSEKTGLDTDNPTEKKAAFPLYAATDSPKKTSRSYLWPFFGYTEDREKKVEEVDYLWPLITKVRGEKRNKDSFLPFYSHETFSGGGEKSWYLWPIYKHEEISSSMFRQDIDRVLFFLYRSSHEYWPKDGSEKRRSALWPLFLYNRSTAGVSSISLPAPVEPILDKEGIEKNWAPLWRVYQRRWDGEGNSASSLLWNLYWHERRGEELAYELFPLISYRGTKEGRELKLLKGLISLKKSGEEQALNLLWLPFGPTWGHK